MPTIIIRHASDLAPKEANEVNSAVRQKVLEKALALGEYPEKITGSTTADMFGTIFRLDDTLPSGVLGFEALMNPRPPDIQVAYGSALIDAALETGFKVDGDPVVSEVTRWEVYPEDAPSYNEPDSP